jgi:hypothetical protein
VAEVEEEEGGNSGWEANVGVEIVCGEEEEEEEGGGGGEVTGGDAEVEGLSKGEESSAIERIDVGGDAWGEYPSRVMCWRKASRGERAEDAL